MTNPIPPPPREPGALELARKTMAWLETQTLDFGDHIHFSALDARSLCAAVIRLSGVITDFAEELGAVEFDDDRIRWRTHQIDREATDKFKAVAAAILAAGAGANGGGAR